MPSGNLYAGVKHVVQLSTNIGESCKHCSTQVGIDNFASGINHYIQQHDYKLLHVGSETSRDMEGKIYNSTVAVLGK